MGRIWKTDTNVNTDIPGIEQQTEVGYQETETQKTETNSSEESTQTQETLSGSFDIKSIPAYSGKAYIGVNDNNPYFTESDLTTKSFEKYAPLDSLGRCGVAYANVGIDIMPTEKRGSIGMVKPSGWHSIKYENVDGKYLYNRCHLIGWQLTAENANKKNLITGTRYLNVDGENFLSPGQLSFSTFNKNTIKSEVKDKSSSMILLSL